MNQYIEQAGELLDLDCLNDSMALLRRYAIEKRNASLLDSLQRIESNYTLMLRYLASGSADPGREQMFCDIRDELRGIILNLEIDEKAADASTLFYSTLRSVRYAGMRFGDPLGRFLSTDATLQLTPLRDGAGALTEDAKRLLNEKDRALRDMFSVVWTLPAGDRRQLEQIVNVAADPDIAFDLRGTIVAALTLGLMEVYDPARLSALLDIEGRTPDERIRARALTGVVLALMTHQECPVPIPADVRLDLRFEAWRDDLSNYRHLREVVYALARTRGSERLARRIEKEIIPGITGIGTDFFRNLKKDADGNIDLEDLQENPDWERLMEESGLDKKLHKLQDMHRKGADMMLPMFSRLSSHHFFKDADIWLRPYETWEAVRLGVPDSMAEMLDHMPPTAPMCDTDKFALMLNISHMPAATRDMMSGAFRAGRSEMTEELKDMELFSPHPDFDLEAINYARVLYRFFSYFRLHKEFHNPFAGNMDFLSLPWFGEMLDEDEIMQYLGETWYHQGFYEDAAAVYERLMFRRNSDSYLLNQKIGYCHERAGNYSEALDAYVEASMIHDTSVNPGHPDRWLYEHIYRMASATDDIMSKLHSLENLLEIEPDNTAYLREWLSVAAANVGNEETDEEFPDFDRQLARYSYLVPDDPLILTLKSEIEWAGGNAAKVAELLAPRCADIEMYLAESSLAGHHGDSGNDGTEGAKAPGKGDSGNIDGAGDIDSEGDPAEQAMASDLLLAASAYAAIGDNASAVEAMRHQRMLRHGYDDDATLAELLRRWSQSESLRRRPLLLSMLMEASRIS